MAIRRKPARPCVRGMSGPASSPVPGFAPDPDRPSGSSSNAPGYRWEAPPGRAETYEEQYP